MTLTDFEREVRSGDRFQFGRNWRNFLSLLTDERIDEAERSLRRFLRCEDLSGRTLLDIGSGSGLFSLAARRLGARVRSFDYDPDSVSCTRSLRATYFADDQSWSVEQGSVLDETFMRSLPGFEVVYSWGVLHHTGDMWKAIALAAERVHDGGQLYIALYNDQGRRSVRWRSVKQVYCRLPGFAKPLFLLPFFLRRRVPMLIRGTLSGSPLKEWREYTRRRGMSPWHDLVDWVGGYPFEVARPEQVLEFLRPRGFTLDALVTVGGGPGCNQYLFTRDQNRSSSFVSSPVR